MVIGDNVEAQLAPYHEFECTGVNDEFVQDVDVTDECREHGLSYHGLEDKTATDEARIDKEGDHKYGYAIVDADGNLIKAVNRTNPNKTWDWWTVGGRWSGFLKLKAGANGIRGERGLLGSCAHAGAGYADVAKKKDIDFDGMRDEAGKRAADLYDKATSAKILAGFTANASWDTWETVRARNGGNIDAARTEYHAQEVKELVSKALGHPFDGVDEYLVPREQFIQEARDRAVSPYALVKDSQWIAKGRMGWFGCSDDKESQADWNRKVNELLDSLPDDTIITVVDCHI